jgi:hypothetical protein
MTHKIYFWLPLLIFFTGLTLEGNVRFDHFTLAAKGGGFDSLQHILYTKSKTGNFNIGKIISRTARRIDNAAKETTTVIDRVNDLQKIGPGEKSLLDRLPNLGNPKANWQQNSGVLRQEMNRGLPIRDASPNDVTGVFLNAERNLLQSRGWVFDKQTNLWMPPK